VASVGRILGCDTTFSPARLEGKVAPEPPRSDSGPTSIVFTKRQGNKNAATFEEIQAFTSVLNELSQAAQNIRPAKKDRDVGAELVTIKGEKGDGDKRDIGDKGESIQGEQGIQ
jgi:hypothetical protein